MGFNLINFIITIGAVFLILILYRQLDRGNRNLRLLRDYAEKLKKDLSTFVEEQEKAVKDYSVSLNVKRDSAIELMKQLQITENELAQKAQSMVRIDTQIKTYEGSLAELDKMTGRVQENMIRVREESAFVEAAGKKISQAKTRLDELEKDLEILGNRFERENAEALGRAAEDVIGSVKSAISDLSFTAENIERQVEEHRQEINKIEVTRAENMARDMDTINKILSAAVKEAGNRADKMEEAALVNLKEQAEERLQRLKTAEEEKLKTYQENAKARVTEVQNLVKNIRDEWRAERAAWDEKDKAWQEEHKKELSGLNALFTETEKRLSVDLVSMEKRMEELLARAGESINSQEESLRNIVENVSNDIQKAAEDMKQKALEITGEKLEEYRSAQDIEFRRLESLADDSERLVAELRSNMQNMTGKIEEEFALFKQESLEAQKTESEKFSAAALALKKEITDTEKELAALKNAASENVSEKLRIFEDDFVLNLTKRSGDIDKRLVEWQEGLETRLSAMAKEAEAARSDLEQNLSDEIRKTLSGQNDKFISELERLKAETGAFEEGIRGQMIAADESAASLRKLLDQSISEARKEAELTIKSEIGRFSIAAADSIKLYQRDLEDKLHEISGFIDTRNSEITSLMDASQTRFDEDRKGLALKIKELDDTVEGARRRVNEYAEESDSRITAVRSSVEDTDRHIKEAISQTGKAEEIRRDMERRIEDLKGEMDRLDQRKAEAAQLENEFVKIRRLHDDVNAKMTRFISDKRRIEIMEGEFNRLIQISREVEEKLKHVTASDDTLQAVQLQIRKLEEAIGSAEDKYQRMERKSQILDNTNEGIDRNFKILQDSEKLSAKIGDNLDRYAEDVSTIKTSIEALAKESEKAREAAEKIDVLDEALDEIEERIKSMQRARQWIADAETRLEDLNRQAQTQARLIESLVKGKKTGSVVDLGEGAPTPQKKENVIILARQGWTVEEIAKNMKLSRGEVELILDMAPRD